MLNYTIGNMFDQEVEAMINPVNCIGVMGKGLALQFKNRFPANFKSYESLCKKGGLRPGTLHVYETKLLSPKYIINFPTKLHWKDNSKIEDIDSGLRSLSIIIKALSIRSVAMPPIGCGLGGLNWNEVKNHIDILLVDLPDTNIIVLKPK